DTPCGLGRSSGGDRDGQEGRERSARGPREEPGSPTRQPRWGGGSESSSAAARARGGGAPRAVINTDHERQDGPEGHGVTDLGGLTTARAPRIIQKSLETSHMKQFVLITVSAAIAATVPVSTPRAQQAAEPSIRLTPTVHPRLPADPTQFWIVPDSSRSPRSAALAEFAAAVRLEVDDNYAQALPIFSSPAPQKGPLGDYAVYYQGLAQLRLNRAAEGRRTFQALQSTHPTGYLLEAAALREAECDETLGDAGAALEI